MKKFKKYYQVIIIYSMLLYILISITSCDTAASNPPKSKRSNVPLTVEEKTYEVYFLYSDPDSAQFYNGGDALTEGFYWEDNQAEWQEFVQEVSPNVLLISSDTLSKSEIKDYFLDIARFNEDDASEAMNTLTSTKSFRIVFYLNSSVNKVFYVVKYSE